VNVERAHAWQIDDALRQDVAVGDDDRDVRLDDVELLEQLRIARVLRLKDWNLFLDRDLLHGRRNYLTRSSLRLVGLSDHTDDFEAFAYQRPQGWLGEIRRTPE
jgi:hypothetical protein